MALLRKTKHVDQNEDPYKSRYVSIPDSKESLRRKRGAEKKSRIISSLFLLPSMIGVLVFFIIPFCIVIYYSMIDNPINKDFVGFSNFVMVFKNLAFRKAAENTMIFSLVAVPLAVLLSLFLAMALENKIPFKSQLRSFFLSPLMVPTASIVLIWQVLFHNNGTFNSILMNMGYAKIDWLNSEYAQLVIVLLFIWKNLGYNMILFMAALSSVPQALLEAASLENASAWQVFWNVKFRYLTSTMLFVTIMSLINSFKVFKEIYLLKGDYPFETMYMLQHFMNNTFHSLDYQKMSSAAIIMAVAMIIIIGVLFNLEAYLGRDVEGD